LAVPVWAVQVWAVPLRAVPLRALKSQDVRGLLLREGDARAEG